MPPNQTDTHVSAPRLVKLDKEETVNAWGLGKDAYSKALADTAKYGPLRVELADQVCKILGEHARELPADTHFFIESGTLMGAFRDGKMIPHDDDFDMGVYTPGVKYGETRVLEAVNDILKAHLPAKYDVRLVTSYAHKLEVHEPAQGFIELNNEKYGASADFCNVTVDITSFVDADDDATAVRPCHITLPSTRIARDAVVPPASMPYCGRSFPAPKDPETFLTSLYGYIGRGGVWDKETSKYVPGSSAPAEDRAEYERQVARARATAVAAGAGSPTSSTASSTSFE